jgi:hypothetical protein
MDGMDAGNPYAATNAPLADGVSAAEREAREADTLPAWRLEGRTLIARNGATLPDICLFTGETTTPAQRVSLPLGWTPLWFRISLVFATMLAAFAYGYFRRSSTLVVGLTQAGRTRRRVMALLALAAAACGVCFLLALADRDGEVFPPPWLFLIPFVALIPIMLLARIFRVTLIDRKFTHIQLRPRVAAAFARLPPPAAPVG